MEAIGRRGRKVVLGLVALAFAMSVVGSAALPAHAGTAAPAPQVRGFDCSQGRVEELFPEMRSSVNGIEEVRFTAGLYKLNLLKNRWELVHTAAWYKGAANHYNNLPTWPSGAKWTNEDTGNAARVVRFNDLTPGTYALMEAYRWHSGAEYPNQWSHVQESDSQSCNVT